MIYPCQGEVQVTLNGGPNPRVESAGMRCGSGEIQSNLEIAGSPEIALGLASVSLGGRALIGLGVLIGLPNSVKLRMPMTYQESDCGVISRQKQPRPPAKVPKCVLSGKDVELLRQLGCWLRSDHHLKCVIAH